MSIEIFTINAPHDDTRSRSYGPWAVISKPVLTAKDIDEANTMLAAGTGWTLREMSDDRVVLERPLACKVLAERCIAAEAKATTQAKRIAKLEAELEKWRDATALGARVDDIARNLEACAAIDSLWGKGQSSESVDDVQGSLAMDPEDRDRFKSAKLDPRLADMVATAKEQGEWDVVRDWLINAPTGVDDDADAVDQTVLVARAYVAGVRGAFGDLPTVTTMLASLRPALIRRGLDCR